MSDSGDVFNPHHHKRIGSVEIGAGRSISVICRTGSISDSRKRRGLLVDATAGGETHRILSSAELRALATLCTVCADEADKLDSKLPTYKQAPSTPEPRAVVHAPSAGKRVAP